MPKTREKYLIADVDVYHVRNRNEQRVAKSLADLIERLGLRDISPETVKDAYAYALNNLPARYTQQGTIVLRDPVRKRAIDDIVSASLEHVLSNPKQQ